MRTYKISLKEAYGIEGGQLECILCESPFDAPAPDWKRPAVIVVPGGAYWGVSKREGEPVASQFLQRLSNVYTHLPLQPRRRFLSRAADRTFGRGGLRKEARRRI